MWQSTARVPRQSFTGSRKIINFSARVISGKKKFDHISAVLKKLNWLSASQLAQYHRAHLIRKVISSELPETLHAIAPAAVYKHEHQTRHNNQLRLPAIRTETGRRQLHTVASNCTTMCARVGVIPFQTSLYRSLRCVPTRDSPCPYHAPLCVY